MGVSSLYKSVMQQTLKTVVNVTASLYSIQLTHRGCNYGQEEEYPVIILNIPFGGYVRIQ